MFSTMHIEQASLCTAASVLLGRVLPFGAWMTMRKTASCKKAEELACDEKNVLI